MPLPGPNQVLSVSAINQELQRSSSNTFNTNDGHFRDVLTDTTQNQPISFSQLRYNAFQVFNITSNTSNYNIKSELIAAGIVWTSNNKVTTFINISNSAIVHSNSHNLAAITSGSGYNANDRIKILVDHGSVVVGGGGVGGRGGIDQDQYAGSGPAGGPAIVTDANTTIINHGLIMGGGGGGGGGSGGYTTPPPPTPCFAWDTEILLIDGTKKNAKDILPGDVLHTLTGKGGTVVKLHEVKLGTHRRFMKFYGKNNNKPLRITDDHDLWIRNKIGIEKFGVYNYNAWLYEEVQMKSYKDGDEIDDVEILLPMTDYEFAVNFGNGWLNTRGEWESEQNPEELVYCIEMDEGMAFIGDDFVICNQDWHDHENENISWSVKV